MDSFGIFLQGLLGVVAFSTLMREWRRGRAGSGRAFTRGEAAGPCPASPQPGPGGGEAAAAAEAKGSGGCSVERPWCCLPGGCAGGCHASIVLPGLGEKFAACLAFRPPLTSALSPRSCAQGR